MNIFEGKLREKDWETKHNFIDDNNVFVGFDAEKECCETADWFISDKIETKIPDHLPKPKKLEGWNFDTSFFKKVSMYDDTNHLYTEEGGIAVFRLIKNNKEKFLHLYNCQNGYYSHGFEMAKEGKTIFEGRV